MSNSPLFTGRHQGGAGIRNRRGRLSQTNREPDSSEGAPVPKAGHLNRAHMRSHASLPRSQSARAGHSTASLTETKAVSTAVPLASSPNHTCKSLILSGAQRSTGFTETFVLPAQSTDVRARGNPGPPPLSHPPSPPNSSLLCPPPPPPLSSTTVQMSVLSQLQSSGD